MQSYTDFTIQFGYIPLYFYIQFIDLLLWCISSGVVF